VLQTATKIGSVRGKGGNRAVHVRTNAATRQRNAGVKGNCPASVRMRVKLGAQRAYGAALVQTETWSVTRTWNGGNVRNQTGGNGEGSETTNETNDRNQAISTLPRKRRYRQMVVRPAREKCSARNVHNAWNGNNGVREEGPANVGINREQYNARLNASGRTENKRRHAV